MKHLNLLLIFLTIILFSCTEQIDQKSDPLPSWNEGKTKQSIIDFVNELKDQASPNFVKPEDRIATFDNDGTLWPEQPYYFQLQFAFDRVKALAPKHPEWKSNPLFQAVLDKHVQERKDSGLPIASVKQVSLSINKKITEVIPDTRSIMDYDKIMKN